LISDTWADDKILKTASTYKIRLEEQRSHVPAMPENALASIAPFVAGAAVGAACMFFAMRPRRMARLMQTTKVRPDKLAAYKTFHASVWPEVESGLLKYGITTLSIWGPSDGNNELKVSGLS
jgi:hypothetical protein